MNILLIIAPSKMYFTYNEVVNPLGILYLASSLESDGRHNVEVLDCLAKAISIKGLIKRLKKNPPNAVGISFTTDARFQAFKTARALREAFPSMIIIGGGPHGTLVPDDTLKHVQAIDILVRGEGERTIIDLLNTLEDQRPLETVPGISFRSDNEVIHNSDSTLIPCIDTIPFPSWDRIDLRDYGLSNKVPDHPNLICANVISARGCPGKCSFCSNPLLWGKSVRVRSASNFVDELQLLYDKFGVRYLRISDDTFNVNHGRVIEICEQIIERRLNLYWDCAFRVDKASLDMIKLMKRAGCVQLVYGVESVNDKTLDGLIGKKISIEQVEQVTAWCREAGLPFTGGYIISFPDEKIEDMHRTLDFMKKTGGRTGLNILRIYPGTGIEKIARERGVLPRDFSWADEKFVIKNTLPALSGPVPLYIENIPWPVLQKALFDWAGDNNIGLLKPLLIALKGIRGFNDITRLFQFGFTYVRRFLN